MIKQVDITGSTRPLLTISIPTYNRACYLRELLSSLLGQLTAESRVELVVSDNASPDETAEVVREFIERGLQIRYIRNATNVGPDANFFQCFEQAHGNYVWIIGDDDSIASGGMKAVLDILDDKAGYDMINIAPHNFYHSPTEKIGRIRPTGRHYVVNDAIKYSHLVNTTGDFIFISTVIVNKDRAIQHMPASSANMIGSQVIQLAWVFSALRSMTRSIYISDRIVLAGRDTHRGNFSAAKVFIVNYLEAMDVWLGDNHQLKDALIDDLMVFWFRNWVSLRKQSGRISTTGARDMVRVLAKRRLKYGIFVLPLVCLPLYMAYLWNRALGIVRMYIRSSRLSRCEQGS
jgi:glycosyltransferase involved in cell wall biosynthesis